MNAPTCIYSRFAARSSVRYSSTVNDGDTTTPRPFFARVRFVFFAMATHCKSRTLPRQPKNSLTLRDRAISVFSMSFTHGSPFFELREGIRGLGRAVLFDFVDWDDEETAPVTRECRYCGRVFTPSKYTPHATRCSSKGCRAACDRERRLANLEKYRARERRNSRRYHKGQKERRDAS